MNQIEKTNRRVEVSAQISDVVYTVENNYTANLPDPLANARKELNDAGIYDVDIVDYMYDKDSGVAAIAVEDTKTGETYIAYAGTNMGANGHKDPIVDLAIALNDTLYLKEKTILPLISTIEWKQVAIILR